MFTEKTPYSPSSPYSASKAVRHLVRAWGRTYDLLMLLTALTIMDRTNFQKKLIPHVILNAIQGKPIPIYGDGLQIRNWLCVEDIEGFVKSYI